MKLRKPSKPTILTLLMAFSLAGALYPPLVRPMRVAMQWLVTPLGDGLMYMTTAFNSRLAESIAPGIAPEDARRLQRENEGLRNRLLALEQQWQLRRQQESAMESLLYGPMHDFPCELIAARVVAADAMPYSGTRVINAGRRHGADAGMRVCRVITDRSKALPPNLAAITASALAGRITESGAFTARLQLVTDANFTIRARIRRIIDPAKPRVIRVLMEGRAAEETLSEANNKPIETPVSGDGTGELIVPDVSKYHNIQPGDYLVTCGDEAFLPAEIGIGRVTRVVDNAKYKGMTTVYAKPLADLSTLRDVYVVLPLGMVEAQKN